MLLITHVSLLTGTSSLNAAVGPYIAVFKTHMDIVSDYSEVTSSLLITISKRHNFLIYEDRKFVDIGNTVQRQYHGGAQHISEWAHIVNASILAGDGTVEALKRLGTSDQFPFKGERALLLIAEMTTQGSLATDTYTRASIESARKHSSFVIGFVANKTLLSLENIDGAAAYEDFVVFTSGIHSTMRGDCYGQQYQTPEAAIAGGSDFIIVGRGIYAADNPVEAAQQYQMEGWKAYVYKIVAADRLAKALQAGGQEGFP